MNKIAVNFDIECASTIHNTETRMTSDSVGSKDFIIIDRANTLRIDKRAHRKRMPKAGNCDIVGLGETC